MKKIRLETEDALYRITLSDPPLNILDLEMLDELREVLARVRNDRHALVISGSGDKAFSAGASVQDHLGDRVERMLSSFHDCFRILDRLELVTIALVDGLALGGGCELALACDFVLASDKSRFGQPEIKLGVFPPVAAYQLSRQLTPRRGLELLLTGEPVDADSALALGLVNRVFPSAEFSSESERWIAKITSLSASALRFAKLAFRKAGSEEFERKLAEVERFYLEELMKSEDAGEGLRAFIEKRRPVWTGR